MAFDAAATVQAPPQGAAVSAKAAARKDYASDPFGALLAMLDNTGDGAAPTAPAAPTTPTRATADVSSNDADKPVSTDAGKEAPTDEVKAPSDAAVSDPALLVAAMMAPPPAAATPAPVAAAPVAETPPAATPAVQVAALSSDLEPPVVAGDAPATRAAPSGDAPAIKTAEAVQTAQPPQPSQPAPAAEIPATAPSEPQAPVSAPVVQAQAAVTPETTPLSQQAPAAPARVAANEQPADPARTDAVATDAEPDVAAAPRAGAQNPHGGHSEGGAHGRPSDAEATQQARSDAPAAPAAENATFAAAAPEAPPPAVGVAQAAAPAPVIAAQAAITPVRGAPETVAHLAAQMIQRLDGQTTRFDLSLNPQSLGRVDVRIEIGAKGALRARMAFDDAATAQEMSGRHTELRAALQNAGFDVPEGALSFDVASGGGGAFADRQDADRTAAPVFHNFADTADQDPAAAVKNYFTAAGSSGVDIRV